MVPRDGREMEITGWHRWLETGGNRLESRAKTPKNRLSKTDWRDGGRGTLGGARGTGTDSNSTQTRKTSPPHKEPSSVSAKNSLIHLVRHALLRLRGDIIPDRSSGRGLINHGGLHRAIFGGIRSLFLTVWIVRTLDEEWGWQQPRQ